MFSLRLLGRIRTAYDDYPRQFWILVLGMFIDTLGRTMLNPFLMLYVTKKFDVGMTEVGMLLGLMSVTSTAAIWSSGETTSDRYEVGSPRVPTTLPARSRHSSSA